MPSTRTHVGAGAGMSDLPAMISPSHGDSRRGASKPDAAPEVNAKFPFRAVFAFNQNRAAGSRAQAERRTEDVSDGPIIPDRAIKPIVLKMMADPNRTRCQAPRRKALPSAAARPCGAPAAKPFKAL